jgi:hypothetical protein
VEAEPEPEPPADDPPVPTDELDMPPPAEVPPVPSVELDCASANAALPAKNVAVNAANERLRLLISFSPESLFISICGCRRSRPDEATEINDRMSTVFLTDYGLP